MLGLRFCAWAFSSCGKWGPLLIAVRGPLTVAASLAAEHKLQTRSLSSCGSRAQLLCGVWDPPDQGSNPCPLHWQAESQPLRHQGSPHGLFYKWRFVPLNCLHLFHPSTMALPSGNHPFVLCTYESLFILFSLFF